MWNPIYDEEAFRSYMKKQAVSKEHVQNSISRCRKVNYWEGNLYQHYTNDRGSSLLDRLTYTKDDVERCIESKHNLPIDGNNGYMSIYYGTASLRNAVQHYFEFLRQLD
ncbi:hypothetical protein BJP49_15610 [Paenibacillus odorifer]|nr:hypothetical protein BJP49_15610 [Paenibacillus odorifer]